MIRLLALAATALTLASAAHAAETVIMGTNAAGTRIEFLIGAGEEAAAGSYPVPSAVSQDPPDAWRTTPLRASFTRPKGAAPGPDEAEKQCVMLYSADYKRHFISCAAQPRNELSGAVYEHRGHGKDGNAIYRCIRGCSRQAPRRLDEIGIDAGC